MNAILAVADFDRKDVNLDLIKLEGKVAPPWERVVDKERERKNGRGRQKQVERERYREKERVREREREKGEDVNLDLIKLEGKVTPPPPLPPSRFFVKQPLRGRLFRMSEVPL